MRAAEHFADRQPLYRLWWLQPAWLFALAVGGTFAVAAYQSDNAYRLYGTPKFITGEHVALAMAAVLVFALGYVLSQATGQTPRATPRRANQVVRYAFWITFVLSLFGYAVWFASAVKNGLSIGLLREFLGTDDPEAFETLANDVFATWPGVTTMAQFAVATVLLGVWLLVNGDRTVIWPTGALVAIAALRAIAFSERLALIELLLPSAVVCLRARVLGKPLSKLTRASFQLAPLLGLATLIFFFGASEYIRSWRYYQHEFDSFPAFTVWRIAGYYSTAHNNGAMALQTQRGNPLPFATVRSLWLFPGLSNTDLGYQRLTGVDPLDQHNRMLEYYGTPELNNEGGLFQPALDFGTAGYLLFWLGCGFVSGRLYRHYLVGTIAGLTLYPLIVIAIMETPRFLYLCYTRSFPGLVALAVVLWFVYRRASYRGIAPSAAAVHSGYA